MLRIISFTMHDHPVIGDLEFNLCNPKEDKVPNYYSIIIGPNGTGKSYLLSNLIYAFNELKLLISRDKYRTKIKFSIEYQLNENHYYISTSEKVVVIKINNKEAEIQNIVLPTKWLASSVTINDKYPLLGINYSQKIPEYKYLGIRAASNNAFIKTIIKNSMLYFVDAISQGKIGKLLTVYKDLSFNPVVTIELTSGKMFKFDKTIDYSDIDKNYKLIIEPHLNFLSRYTSVKSYRSDTYTKYIGNDNLILDVYKFLIYKLNLNHDFNKDRPILYDVGLENGHGVEILLKEWELVLVALDLELLDFKKFIITKDFGFSYEDASSGENHLLTSLHGIIANIEDNSLLVIDEPEISLHPNWQIDYIDILKKIVDGYSGVNTVIATHSHFIVSGLKNEESRILSLKKDKKNNQLKIDDLDFETYGWSAEEILFTIFNVKTIRNSFIEYELTKLISLINKGSKEFKSIKKILNKLAILELTDGDPLKIIIEKGNKYIQDNNA